MSIRLENGLTSSSAALLYLPLAGGTMTGGITNSTSVNPLTTLAESWIGPSSTAGVYFKGGNVGIGTTGPGEKLEVANGNLLLSSATSNLYLANNAYGLGVSGGNLTLKGYSNLTISADEVANASYYLAFKTANSERVRITNGGNVGIGTTSPVSDFGSSGSVLQIEGVQPTLILKNDNNGYTGSGQVIQFNVTWPTDAFSTSSDVAWVFFKYKVNSTGVYYHAHLISGGSLTPVDGMGVFAPIGNNQTVIWDYTSDGVLPANVTLYAFSVEMRLVPTGSFYVGSGGTETSPFYTYPTTTNAYLISSEAAITVGTGTGNLYYASGTNIGDAAGPIPAAFPKGYAAFYMMKYDLTQGQYRDFLNTLTRAQQVNRVATNISASGAVTNTFVMVGGATQTSPGRTNPTTGYGNGIACTSTLADATTPVTFFCDLNNNGIGNEANDGEWIACNYLSWQDLCSYAAWACLRPMTELEYEKAARGPSTPLANEYAWGSTNIYGATTIFNAGTISEIACSSPTSCSSPANCTTWANCNYNAYANVYGPLRTGFASTSTSTTRESAGASFYGIMELSGNVWERAVGIGMSAGRSFTGTNGNGTLSTSGTAAKNGYATNSDWPGAVQTNWNGANGYEVNANTGGGCRGGNWNSDWTHARVSDRYYAAYPNTYRSYSFGGRLVRTSP